MASAQKTILCISSYEKGFDFLKQCHKLGWRVILLTSNSLAEAPWPKESIDEIYYIPDVEKEWDMKEVLNAVSYLCRTEKINKIVALDDFDVEKAATLREHLRIPGMGETTVRYFRDKLAMRMKAHEDKIAVPPFIHVLNHNEINDFMEKVEPPYILKPRSQAGAIGMKKCHDKMELWDAVNSLGDEQSYYLVEKFVPGNIYHVDTIIYNSKVEFAVASQYAKPPMEVAHEGRVFCTSLMKKGSKDEKKLLALNEKVLGSMGLKHGVSHTEFIKSEEDGKLYFLETSARVGGANIAEMVEAGTGINLWKEWAKLETKPRKYKPPVAKDNYSGILISLARQEYPDTSNYDAPEIKWRINKKFHAGLILASNDYKKVQALLSEYTERFYDDFFATQPIKQKPSD
ncbi:MAG: hypothetical protein SCALA702_35960 [Melioribacteraceae bacterium]|nr:MAG: hypothetical protein SCALA702_35960 [Melioribacteraceae bacterium]